MKMQSQSGVILITTLWILLILSVVALGFSIELHLEARMARYQIDSHEAYYMAKAGVERAMVELKNDAVLDHKAKPAQYDSLGDCWSLTDDTKDIFTDVELENGKYTVNVVDEYSKLNINKASEPMLEGLFRALNFEEEDAKIYAGAILDFRDPDEVYSFDTTLTEMEYYFPEEDTTLGIQHFRNAEFVSPDELLKVPGITPAILYTPREVYGDPEKKVAMVDLLTVYGDGVVNINTATLPVMTAVVLGLGETDIDNAVTAAEKIIDHRDGSDDEPGTTDDKPYVNPSEVSNELGSYNPVLASRIGASMKVASNLFEITSTGEVSKAKKQIKALVYREWIVNVLTEEERQDIENENKGIKEGVKLQVKRWMEL